MNGLLNVHVVSNNISALEVDELVNYITQAVTDFEENNEARAKVVANFSCKN
jgi:hypothetical protein